MLGFLMGLAVMATITLLIASELLKKEERDETWKRLEALEEFMKKMEDKGEKNEKRN